MTHGRKTHYLPCVIDGASLAVITAQSAKISHFCPVGAGYKGMTVMIWVRVRDIRCGASDCLASIVDIIGPTEDPAESSKVSHVCPVGAGYKSTRWSGRVVVPYDLARVIDSESGTVLSSKTPHTMPFGPVIKA